MSEEMYDILVEQLTIKNTFLKHLVERLKQQKQKVIALIKDGRFVEALQELENK